MNRVHLRVQEDAEDDESGERKRGQERRERLGRGSIEALSKANDERDEERGERVHGVALVDLRIESRCEHRDLHQEPEDRSDGGCHEGALNAAFEPA